MPTPTITTAKNRKRCPICNRMVEVGADCIARDERRQQNGSRSTPHGTYTRGAWHQYHPACWDSFATAAGLPTVKADA